MEINARINWKPGMELTSALLNKLYGFSENSRVALCNSFFSRAGIIPDTELDIYASFVNRQLELDVRSLHAALPEGELLDFDGKASVPVKDLSDGSWYACAGLGDEVEFESEGIPCVRDSVTFSIMSLEEAGSSKVIPLVKLLVGDGSVEIDRDYIAPVFKLSSDSRLKQWKDRIASALSELLKHPKLVNEDLRSLLTLTYSRFVRVTRNGYTEVLLSLCNDVVSLLDAYLLHAPEEDYEWPENFFLDISLVLKFTEDAISKGVTALDELEIVDDSIDFDALKAQIVSEVTDRVRSDLMSEIDSRLTSLETSLSERLLYNIRELVPEEVDKLRDGLRDEISQNLRESLYPALYDALYNALFVPKEEKKDMFTPII